MCLEIVLTVHKQVHNWIKTGDFSIDWHLPNEIVWGMKPNLTEALVGKSSDRNWFSSLGSHFQRSRTPSFANQLKTFQLERENSKTLKLKIEVKKIKALSDHLKRDPGTIKSEFHRGTPLSARGSFWRQKPTFNLNKKENFLVIFNTFGVCLFGILSAIWDFVSFYFCICDDLIQISNGLGFVCTIVRHCEWFVTF